MMEYVLNNPISMDSVPFVQNDKTDKIAEELMERQKDFLRQKLEHDSAAQIEWQNAQPIHTTFRLNGRVVGTIGTNTGFTTTGISAHGEYLQAHAMADQKGLTGEARSDFVVQQVGEALKQRYGAAFEVITHDKNDRPTTGEVHAEMFGRPAPPPEPYKPNEDELAYMKFFAQLYAQRFGEDPFEGIEMPFE